MKYSIFAALFMLLAFSCQKDDDLVTVGDTLEWTCGEDAAKVEKGLKTNQALELSLTIETNSLCPNSDIWLRIESGANTLLNDSIGIFPYETNLIIPPNTKLKITTEVVDNGTLAICSRLGNVDVSVEF